MNINDRLRAKLEHPSMWLWLKIKLTHGASGGGGSPPPSTAGEPVGLLLLLTKAS